jgi:hypothetical protein
MENLAPPLSVVLQLQLEMENGHSFRESLRQMLRSHDENDFMKTIREWSVRKSHNQSTLLLVKSLTSPYRRTLLDLFERGWEGEPILEPLQSIEEEIRIAAQAELDQFIATLPFRAMIPLLLLQFPAYMLLLLGPILSDLSRQLGSM